MSSGSKKKSRKPRKRRSIRRRAVNWSLILLALFAVYFFTSPYMTGWAISRSIESKDEQRLAELIDFPRLRKDVKQHLEVEIIKKARRELNEKPGILKFLSAGPKQEAEILAMRAMINRELTPKALIARANEHSDGHSDFSFDDLEIEIAYTGLSTLHFDIFNVRFFAEWDFWDWRICGCEALPHFKLPAGFSFSESPEADQKNSPIQ